jgi:hypothetical protein
VAAPWPWRGGTRVSGYDGDSVRHVGQLQQQRQNRAGYCPAGRPGGLALGGLRLPLPVQAARPGKAVITFILLAWVLAIATFLVCVAVYIVQARQDYSGHTTPTNPILAVTVGAAGVTFMIILISNRDGSWTGLVSAAVGALAAPMIFEPPFDLIVMARIYPRCILIRLSIAPCSSCRCLSSRSSRCRS